MGVIAPEPKHKNNGSRRKNSGNWYGFLIFLFIAVGLPFLIIKSCSSNTKTYSKSVVSSESSAADESESSYSLNADSDADGYAESADEKNSGLDEISTSRLISLENEKTSAGDSNVSEIESASARFSDEASWYYSAAKKWNSSKEVYELTAPVVDVPGILSRSQYIELADFILELEKENGVQIAVLIVKSMNGDDIESYSMRHAEYWKLGQKGIDNGALLTVAMEEHDVRIETGYGTEGALTDAKCARIIRNILIPAFRKSQYGEGIISAVKNMAGIIIQDDSLVTISDEDVSENEHTGDNTGVIMILTFLLVFIIFVILSVTTNNHAGTGGGTRNRRHRNYYGGNSSVFGSGNSSSHSSGFGGFSGGGGGFGGGGASGHW